MKWRFARGLGKAPLAETHDFFALFALDPLLSVKIYSKKCDNPHRESGNCNQRGLYAGCSLNSGR